VAFDWGETVQLDDAARRVPAEAHSLPRRRRTPSTIAYRPAPLRFRLPPTQLELAEIGLCQAETEVTVFDFGAASLAFRVPFSLTTSQLTLLANALSAQQWLLARAKQMGEPLFNQIRPAIKDAKWSDLYEEYFTFELTPNEKLPSAAEWIASDPEWFAGLLRLDSGVLAPEEVQEAIRLRLSYRPEDSVLVDWSACVVLDCDCDETIHTIEFANLQLLEYRYIDRILDDTLSEAQRLIQPVAASWLPFWRTHSRPLRTLGQLRIETVGTFERASSVLQLVGDQYVSRVYRMVSARFRLDEWVTSIRRTLDVIEGVHQVLSGQSAMYRLEIIEIVIVLLIMLEIGLALIGP
jgi:hypothetical protein